ncbi:hypothetical protein ACP4OV_026375 [Aristida adscensionis]
MIVPAIAAVAVEVPAALLSELPPLHPKYPPLPDAWPCLRTWRRKRPWPQRRGSATATLRHVEGLRRRGCGIGVRDAQGGQRRLCDTGSTERLRAQRLGRRLRFF